MAINEYFEFGLNSFLDDTLRQRGVFYLGNCFEVGFDYHMPRTEYLPHYSNDWEWKDIMTELEYNRLARIPFA